jgi:hypothetical protein
MKRFFLLIKSHINHFGQNLTKIWPFWGVFHPLKNLNAFKNGQNMFTSMARKFLENIQGPDPAQFQL